jgi:hypothetical protein
MSDPEREKHYRAFARAVLYPPREEGDDDDREEGEEEDF